MSAARDGSAAEAAGAGWRDTVACGTTEVLPSQIRASPSVSRATPWKRSSSLIASMQAESRRGNWSLRAPIGEAVMPLKKRQHLF